METNKPIFPEVGSPEFEAGLDSFMGAAKPITYVPDATPEELAGQAVADGKKAALQNSFNTAIKEANPQREAEAQALAASLNLPVSAVRQNLEELKLRKAQREFQQQDLLKRFPATGQFLSNPDNAALATDDYQNLQALEGVLAPSAGGPRGALVPNFGRALLNQWPNVSAGLYSSAADIMGLGDAFIGQPFTQLTGLELFFSHAKAGLESAADTARGESQRLGSYLAGATGVERIGYGALTSLGVSLPGTAVAVATRNPSLAIGSAAGTTGLAAYDQARQAGLTPARALLFAGKQGAAEGIFEILPMHMLIGDLKVGSELGRSFFANLLTAVPKNIVAETATEIPTTIVQNFNEWADLNPDKPFSTYLAQLPSDIVDTVLITAMSAGFQSSAAVMVNQYVHGKDALAKSEEQMAFINKIHDLANATQLRQRNPQSFEQFVQQVSEDGPVKDVFIDGQTLAQSGIDISTLTDDVKKQVQEAQATGGTVRIPVEQYAARLAGQEGSQELLQHLKLSPHSMSKVEADVYMQQEGETLKADIEKALATRQTDQVFMDSKAKVETSILDQLNAAGRFTSSVNQSYATLASSFYAVQASRLGITPEEMYQRYPLRVQSNLASGIAFSQDTASPAFKNWFRESKAVNAKGEPLTVYHGTDAKFDTFKQGKGRVSTVFGTHETSRHGFFFAEDEPLAREFSGKDGGVIAAHLSIQNPLDLENLTDETIAKLEAAGISRRFFTVRSPGEMWELFDGEDGDFAMPIIKQLGYDGAIMVEPDGNNILRRVWVAFSPEQIKSTDNVGTFDPNNANIYHQGVVPSADTIKRDELGFYSAVAKEVSKMNLPAWKPNPAKALTPEEATRLNELKGMDVGKMSEQEFQEWEKLKGRPREAQGLASGKDIWQKVKSLPVKNEELTWLGIEDFLQTRDKFTREEVLNFIDENGVKVEEVVADQSEDDSQLSFDGGEVWDDPEAWEYRADDLKDEIREEDGYEIESGIINSIIEDEESYIRKNMPADTLGEPMTESEKARLAELRAEGINSTTHPDYKEFDALLNREAEATGLPSNLLGDERVIEYVKQEWADKIAERVDEAVEERAIQRAEEEYRSDPIMVYRAETAKGDEIYIFGNDGTGYSIRPNDWRQSANEVDNDIWSYSEAEIRANDWAREHWGLLSEEDENVAKRADYTMGGRNDNYREIKLTLPEVEGDFHNTVHFPDRNIVAFLRVDDRKLPLAGVAKETLKGLDTRVPDGEDMMGEYAYDIGGQGEVSTGRTFGGWMAVYNQLDASAKANEAAAKAAFDGVLEKGYFEDKQELADAWAADGEKRLKATFRITDGGHLRQTDPQGYDTLLVYTEDLANKLRLGEMLQNKINDYRDEAMVKAVNGLQRMPDPVTVEGSFKPEFVVEQNTYPGAVLEGTWHVRITNGPKNTSYEDWTSKSFDTQEEAEAFKAQTDLATRELSYTQRVNPKWQVGKTYFIDEFQSDWHQKGNSDGYASTPEELTRLRNERDATDNALESRKYELAGKLEEKLKGPLHDVYVAAWEDPSEANLAKLFQGIYNAPPEYTPTDYEISSLRDQLPDKRFVTDGFEGQPFKNFVYEKASAMPELRPLKAAAAKADEDYRTARDGVPNAPFKDDGWIALGVKRAILDAVEKGYDQIGWAGAQTVTTRWSDRYETAYTNQYDKKMPSLFKKLTGQQPVQLPYSSSENYWVVEITPELRQKVMDEGFSLFQNKAEIKRGAYTPSTRTITLLADADLSTFLHELGHHMLEVQFDIADQPDAPKDIRDDFDALLKWYDIKGKSQLARRDVWRAMSLDEKRKYHEKFARGFEAYLFKGNAPAPGLKPLFQRFRAWLINVYSQLKALNVSLTKDVTSVMDRMLASAEEIKQAEEMQRFEPLFADAAAAGMTPDEFLDYQRLGTEATADAIDKLERRNLRDMQWLSNARARGIEDLRKRSAAKRREVQAEVTAQIRDEPVYRAMDFFKRGVVGDLTLPEGTPHKISTKGAKEVLGNERYSQLSGWFGKYGMLAENGMHPDAAAELFGFTSGDHLLNALTNAEPIQQKIEGLADQRMLEQYGDLTDPESIERAVMGALANDARAKFIQAEITALNNALGGRKFWAEAAKQFAETMVGRQRIRDLRPAQYEAAEAKAAKEAQKAFAKSDLEVAAANKRNQLVNLYAAKGARKAQDDIEKGLRYFKKFDRKKRKGRPKIDADYRDQIDQLLERYDLKPITNKAADARVALRDWMDKQAEAGLEPDLPDYVINDARKRSFKELSVEEFRGLVDAIKQIEHVGRAKHKLFTAEKQKQYEAAKAEVLEAIEKNAPKGRKPNLRTRTNAGGRVGEMGKSFLAMHRKMASVLREMDGFKDGGPLWEYIVRPMNAAGNNETTMREQATLKLAEITKNLLKSKEVMGGKGVFFKSVGMSLNREERISIALNLGNEGNMQRLLDGEGWTVEQLEPVLDTLSKEDWDFVQSVWDYFETYRPQIAAKERRVFGREPEWIKPRPVVTKHGTYPGGYYPIRYDPKASGKSKQFMKAEEAKQMMRGAFNASTTRRSFTKTRAEKVTGRPLLYSFNTIYQGTEEIIHDLTHHEWLIDATKFLRDPEFDKAVRTTWGPEFVDLMQSAVDDIAKGYQPAENVFEASVSHIRKGSTVTGLGWNFATALLQPLGLTNSMARIGPGWVGRGLVSWFKAPVDKVEEVYSKSEFMRLRAKTMQRELNEIQNRLQAPGKTQAAVGKAVGAQNAQLAKEWVQWSMFLTIQKMQLVADIPTWLGQYEKSIAAGESDKRAAELADQAVIDAQGGGQVKDLAEIQRGSTYQQLFTNFYSYFNVVYNLNAEVYNRTDWKNPYEVAVAARDYMLLMVVPAVLGKLLKDALTGSGDDYDDPEKLAKALAAEQISYLLGTMVGLREATAAVQRVAGVSQFNMSYGGPAGLRFFQELDKLGTQIAQGKPDRALRKSALNTAGILFHLPAAQINRSLDGLQALVDGKTSNPLAVIGGPPR